MNSVSNMSGFENSKSEIKEESESSLSEGSDLESEMRKCYTILSNIDVKTKALEMKFTDIHRINSLDTDINISDQNCNEILSETDMKTEALGIDSQRLNFIEFTDTNIVDENKIINLGKNIEKPLMNSKEEPKVKIEVLCVQELKESNAYESFEFTDINTYDETKKINSNNNNTEKPLITFKEEPKIKIEVACDQDLKKEINAYESIEFTDINLYDKNKKINSDKNNTEKPLLNLKEEPKDEIEVNLEQDLKKENNPNDDYVVIVSEDSDLDFEITKCNEVLYNSDIKESNTKFKEQKKCVFENKNNVKIEIELNIRHKSGDYNSASTLDEKNNSYEKTSVCNSTSEESYKKIIKPKSVSPSTSKNIEQAILKKEPINDNTTKNVKDYFEDERDDIINPKWQAVKDLSTNEERYLQVRNCWKSRTIPNPNKNLTYHSYRKRQFNSADLRQRTIKQHKRHASTSLYGKEAKRPCTFFIDEEINSIEKTKNQKKQEIFNEMHKKIISIDEQHFQNERLMQNEYNGINRCEELHYRYNNKVYIISDEYNKMANSCEKTFRNQLHTLEERRNEVLKFYRFYKGLNDINEDPTYLTESQFEELNDIENIYRQFNEYYKQ